MLRIAVASLIALTATTADARVCVGRDDLVKELAKVHGEVRMSVGLQRNSGVIETYANIETGTWTIIVSMPNGLSCILAAGEAYMREAQKPGKQS